MSGNPGPRAQSQPRAGSPEIVVQPQDLPPPAGLLASPVPTEHPTPQQPGPFPADRVLRGEAGTWFSPEKRVQARCHALWPEANCLTSLGLGAPPAKEDLKSISRPTSQAARSVMDIKGKGSLKEKGKMKA